MQIYRFENNNNTVERLQGPRVGFELAAFGFPEQWTENPKAAGSNPALG